MALSIDPTLFSRDHGFVEGGWEQDPRFLVRTAQVEAAAAALREVAERLTCVGDSGREWPSQIAALLAEDDVPSLDGDVQVDATGARLALDAHGWVTEPMAVTMFRILVEVLDRHGVDGVLCADGPVL